MLHLIFTVCLSTAPATCAEQSISMIEQRRSVCYMQAQPMLANWINDHPGWRIIRWSCVADTEREFNA